MNIAHSEWNFEAILDEYGEKLIRLAFLYVKDWSAAEDIVQDAFLRFYQKSHQFKGESSLLTYLSRIVINLSYNYLRKSRYKTILGLDALRGIVSNDRSIEEEVENNQAHSELAAEILSLPLKYREAIILYYYQELKVHEISDLLQTSENTVKSRLSRARTLLKKSLHEKGLEVGIDE
jgi:RNA polymerase sigma factor (sigma-70 family)